MLVLTRKRDERIQIGSAEVTVLRIEGNQVRLGIAAPAEVRIMRLPPAGNEPEPAPADTPPEPDPVGAQKNAAP